MDIYDRIQELMDANGEKASDLSKATGISTGLLSQWKSRMQKPSYQKLLEISKHYNVPVDYLMSGEDAVVLCPDCGIWYNLKSEEDVKRHEKNHQLWKKAASKYGFCWSYALREQKKADARNDIAENNPSETKYTEDRITEFKALFSRSLEQNDYSLQHVSFEDYVAMLLNQDCWKREIKKSVYDALVNKYGKKEGIKSGTYYKIENSPAVSSRGKIPKNYELLNSENKELIDNLIEKLAKNQSEQ